jgi:hypothetical protein
LVDCERVGLRKGAEKHLNKAGWWTVMHDDDVKMGIDMNKEESDGFDH